MKVDRLVSIIMVLLEKRRIGARELAERFEVSRRTIYRDIDAICMAGIPVRAAPGVGGGFEIMPEYKLDSKVFSADELAALVMGLNSLAGMARGAEAAHALAKVKSLIPAEQAREVERGAGLLRVDAVPWLGSGGVGQTLETVKAALRESRLLAFTYTDGRGRQTERLAEPCQLVFKGGNWYVQCYCREKEDHRLFRLSRMTSLRILPETFAPRARREPVLDFEPYAEVLQTDITLRVHGSVLDRVLDVCAHERVTPDGDGYFLVRWPFIERDYYYDMLLAFGDKCECIAPAHVRGEVRRRIRSMARIYGD